MVYKHFKDKGINKIERHEYKNVQITIKHRR